MILKEDGHPMQAFSHSRVASSMCLSAGKHGVPLFFAKVPYLWKELNFKERRMCADRIRRPCRVLVSMAKKQKAAAGIRKPLEAIALAGLCAAFAGTPVLSRAVSPVPVYAESRDAGGETGKTKAGIAVVNLDEGVVVDGKPVRYSDQIVSLPETGDYTFVTLAEAQTGIDTGRFGGYVLIPAGFSRTVVSINSQPDPCEVQYFINKALDKEDVYASLQAVHAFKDRLSDSMSYMYVNNILEEFHTAQESAETVLENDRTDLASANAVQSEGILSAVTFSEMAVPADTTTPLNAAAYITRNAEILSSIAEDYSAKDSETAARMSAMQQAGAGLSETLAFLAQDSSGVLDGVSGVTLGEAVTGAQETVGEAKAGAETLKTGAGEGLSAVGAQYEDTVARIREAVKEANRDTEEDAKDDVRSLVERLRDSVPGISVRVSPDGQACTVTPEGGKEEKEELPEITIAIEDPDREMVEDNVELMRLILSVVFLEKDRTTVVTTTGPAEESGVNDPLDETGDGTEDSTGDDDKEQPESIGTETVLEVTVKEALAAADEDPNVKAYLAKTGYGSAEDFMAAANDGTLLLTSRPELVIRSDEKDLEAFRDFLVQDFDPEKEAEGFRVGYVDAYERDEDGKTVTDSDGEKVPVYGSLSKAFADTLSSVRMGIEEGMDGLGSRFDGIAEGAAALSSAAADMDTAVAAAKTGVLSVSASETEAIGAFSTEIAAVNASPADVSGMAGNMDALNQNCQSYEEAAADSNQSYMTYAGNVVTIANENIARIREDVETADAASEAAIEAAIAAFKTQKAQTSAENQALLLAFTTKLAYTRLGGLPYTDAYRFIASPLNAVDTSKQAPVSVAPSGSSGEAKTTVPERGAESAASRGAGPEKQETSAPEVTAVPAEVPGSAGGRAVPYIAGIAGAAAAGAGLLIFKKRKHD